MIRILIITLSLFFLVGCDFDDILLMISDDNETNTEQILIHNQVAIEDLEHTAHFKNGALEHILEGELNGRGQAVGFHYDELPTKKGRVIPGTETEQNEFGVYEARVEVSNVEKTSNHGKSTFFPKTWDAQEVVDAINEVYAIKTFISGNTYEGLTKDGMHIRMYLDQKEKIISAFPIY